MAAVLEEVTAAGDPGQAVAGRNPWALAGRQLVRNRLAMASLALFLLIVLACFLAPFYAQTRTLLEDVLGNPERNLFAFLHDALLRTAAHLGLEAVIRVSSTVPIDHALTGQDKVLALCEALGATTYINPIGGIELYSREHFVARGIELHFLKPLPLEYAQFGRPFVPWLSIVDVLMFNELDTVRAWLDSHYELT